MKKILIFLTVMIFMVSFVAADAESTFTDAADRIVSLQNSNGSWDWVVTDDTGPTATTYRNIAGVTGEVLLDAYDFTSDSSYLASAEDTGDYILSFPISSANRYNAFNINFLYNLYDATGNSDYKDHADDLINHILNEENYWSTNNGGHCGESAGDNLNGCTANELLEALKSYRSGQGDPSGIVPWDLYNFIEAAQTSGESSFALDMANEIDSYLSQGSYISSVSYYELGLSAGILGLGQAGLDYSAHLLSLLGEQNPDGSFSDEPIQGTAYALMALEYAEESDEANDAASYLISNFGYDEINGWLESDSNEYSEVTSEAAQALYDTLSEGQEVEGTLQDYFWSISVTPNPLSFGSIPRGSSITDLAENGPVNIDATGSETETDSVYVYTSVIGTDSSFYSSLLEIDEDNDDSGWESIGSIGGLIIPEGGDRDYGARLFGDTSNLEPGPKSATIIYTAYGAPLP